MLYRQARFAGSCLRGAISESSDVQDGYHVAFHSTEINEVVAMREHFLLQSNVARAPLISRASLICHPVLSLTPWP